MVAGVVRARALPPGAALLRRQRWQRRQRRGLVTAARSSSAAEEAAALALFCPEVADQEPPPWRLGRSPERGRGLVASRALRPGEAALRLPSSGLLAVPLPKEDDEQPSAAKARRIAYEAYLDAWARDNHAGLPRALQRLLVSGCASEAGGEAAVVGPAVRLAALLLWAVAGAGGRWRAYASAVLPRPPPSLLLRTGGGDDVLWRPEPQSLLLDAWEGELDHASTEGASDLVDKARSMRLQASEAVAAATAALRWRSEEEEEPEEAEAWLQAVCSGGKEAQQWWWWALDMAKSRAFALELGQLRLAVLAPIADLLNHDDSSSGAPPCRCNLVEGGAALPPFSLVVSAGRNGVAAGQELTLDYASSEGGGSGLDSLALACGYRFVPPGGCGADRLPPETARRVWSRAGGGGEANPPRLTPALRRALARAADDLVADAGAEPGLRARAHRALASLLVEEARAGGGGGAGGPSPLPRSPPPQQQQSEVVAALLRERALLEEAAAQLLARVRWDEV